MTSIEKSTHYCSMLTVILFTSISLGLTYMMRNAIVDDAFIYLQVARNISLKGEWSFNAGFIANACSSPLYVLLLSLLLSLGFTGKAALLFLYSVSLALGAKVIFELMRKIDFSFAGASVLVFFSCPALLTACGLETGLFYLTVLLSVYYYSEKQTVLFSIALAALPLLRPEGLLLFPILFSCSLLHREKVRLFIFPFVFLCAVLLTWVIFSYLEFGSFLSNSILVKIDQGQDRNHSVSYFDTFVRRSEFPFFACLLALAGMLKLWGAYTHKQYTPLLVLVIFGVLQLASYSILRAPTTYWWYQVPNLLGLNLLALLGTFTIVKKFLRLQGSSVIAQILLVLLLSSTTYFFAFDSVKYFSRRYRLAEEYQRIGLWLRENAPEGSTVAAAEIGYIAYYSERPMLDMYGLIHPEFRAAVRESEYWWFQEHQPDYIVSYYLPRHGEPSEDWPQAVRRRFERRYRRKLLVGNVALYALVTESKEQQA